MFRLPRVKTFGVFLHNIFYWFTLVSSTKILFMCTAHLTSRSTIDSEVMDKSGYELRKRKVLRRCLKTESDGAEIMFDG